MNYTLHALTTPTVHCFGCAQAAPPPPERARGSLEVLGPLVRLDPPYGTTGPDHGTFIGGWQGLVSTRNTSNAFLGDGFGEYPDTARTSGKLRELCLVLVDTAGVANTGLCIPEEYVELRVGS